MEDTGSLAEDKGDRVLTMDAMQQTWDRGVAINQVERIHQRARVLRSEED